YATMVLPLAYARTAIFDSTLTLCTTGAMLWFWDERPVTAWGALAIGALTKGPIALAIPLLALVAHALLIGTSVRRLFPWRGRAARSARARGALAHLLGDRAPALPVPQPVQAAAVRAAPRPGVRAGGHAQCVLRRQCHRRARLRHRRHPARFGPRSAHALAAGTNQFDVGRKGRHPAHRRRARDRGPLLGCPRRPRRPRRAAPHDHLRVLGRRDDDPLALREVVDRGGGGPFVRGRRQRHRCGVARDRRLRRRARGARIPAGPPVLPATGHSGGHRHRRRAHEQLHRRQRGTVPRPPGLAPAPGRRLEGSARALFRLNGVSHERWDPRGAQCARRRAAAPRGGRPFRGVRPLPPSHGLTTFPTSATSPGPGKGAVMCGIFGAVSLTGAPLKHPDCIASMAAALAHRGPDGERI